VSLELLIENLTNAITGLTKVMYESTAHATPAPRAAPTVAPAPVVPATPVVAVPEPVPAVVVPVPPAPSFAAPFTDSKGLTAYCMKKYGELGPVRGGNIQGVLTSIGCKNLSEVTPEKYAEFYTKVEAL
jgi:hypothetical protein